MQAVPNRPQKSKWLILQLPTVTPSSIQLWLSIPVVLNLAWFVAPFQRLSTLVAHCSSIGFCNITAELFGKGLCSWPPENRSMAPKGAEGPSWETWIYLIHIDQRFLNFSVTPPLALVIDARASTNITIKHKKSRTTVHLLLSCFSTVCRCHCRALCEPFTHTPPVQETRI